VSLLVFVAVFAAALGLGRSLLLYLYGDQRRAVERLRDRAPAARPEEPGLAALLRDLLPRVGTLVVPGDRARQARLKARMTQAGIYGPNAVTILLGAQLLLLLVLPVLAGLLPFSLGLLPRGTALLSALVAGGVGLLTPGLWVDYQRRKHQNDLRRALPDALDMLVLCVEAGLSLNAALQRVTAELQLAHASLARELTIVQREVQLGLSVGDALGKLGDRCGVAEVRQLAAVVQQSERYGTSSVKALRLHSEGCRVERQQQAEERARKAAVKIVFPTLLCIFPAIFVVIVGPAAYQIAGMLAKMR
jgi:tight adherence protein C